MNRNRFLGIAFIVLLVGALSMSVLQYKKAFTPMTWVTLKADRTGAQILSGAEVKLRGVVVGDVRDITSDGKTATLRLALNPAMTDQIPSNVSARLLPKTLFGERYVALMPPEGRSAGPLRAGAVISQDRTTSAIELERVLDNLLPLLQTIKPDKLAATLGAVAEALRGNGDRIGQDLVAADAYLTAINKEMPTLQEDVRKLADVLNTYDGAMPDLLAILRDATVNMNTISEQRAQLAAFLATTTSTSDVTRSFLDRHDDQLIQVGSVSRPVLELFAKYAPAFKCTLDGLQNLQPRVEKVFSDGRMHITVEVNQNQGKYEPGDEPFYGAKDGPGCLGLANPPVPAPETPIVDGYDHGKDRHTPKLPVGIPAGTPLSNPAMGYAGTPEEQALVKPLIGAATGTSPAEVPDIAVFLWGPLLRGAVVNAQ
ncbi:MCE family protein [Planosporangium flavigriseum]|uniref:ABC transporter substrate-binding protein n=1 Tax=Planosporangium flavigriseum TaxID=373681 RepID=A0A8J3LDW2_9ACTN|nr:MCE family protein [Planosporangium flavigriseum]NJC65019.1 MCE family protein [Planosporangium flavigriseum]GIG71633.1 ABC transporter substrate-binding protein [Planosporangium flavigriseum]